MKQILKQGLKRRILTIVLTLCLTIGSVQVFLPANASADVVTSQQEKVSPEKGDSINGFRVIKVKYDSDTKTNQIYFEHVKSGAKMLVLKNESKDRGFAVSFNTPTEGDTGINHILEHSILGGSEKYPSSNLAFDLNNSTYSSYVNAFTYQNMTMYPVCSESEEQLMKSTDIYMDAVYHPLIAKDKKVFEREGWRYELTGDKALLGLNGIVYSEMKGDTGNIQNVAHENAKKVIFSDTNQSNNSGGDPNVIPTLSYEQFLKKYKQNYHPSNSFMVLYGDLDYSAFLKMIDENYLSSYSKKEFDVKRQEQKKFKKLVEKQYFFPESKDANTKNKAVIELVFAIPDLKKVGIDKLTGLILATSILNIETSDLKIALNKSGIAETYSLQLYSDTYQPTIHIIANNADASRSKEFYQLVMKELKNSVKKELNHELLESFFTSMKFDKVLGMEADSSKDVLTNVCFNNNIYDEPLMDVQGYYESIGKKASTGYLENLINTYMVKNTHAGLITTIPKAGLLEKNNRAFINKMKKKKDAMSKAERKNLIKATKEFNEQSTINTPKEVLDSLNALKIKDLPTEIKEYTVEDTRKDGYRQLIADSNTTDVGNIGFVFNEQHLTKEELLYMTFYADLMNSAMPTEKYNENEIINFVTKNINGLVFSAEVIANEKEKDNFYPAFTIKLNSMDEAYKDNLLFVKELILNRDLKKLPTYAKKVIASMKMYFKAVFDEPLNFIVRRSSAYTNPNSRMEEYLAGLEYYDFILAIEKELESNPQKVIEMLKSTRDKMFSKKDLTVLFAGGKESQKKYLESLPVFTESLSDEIHQKAIYTFEKFKKREAFTTSSTIQAMAVNAEFDENIVKYNGKYNVFSTLISNKFLIPEIRRKGGAYTVGSEASSANFVSYTRRDNNFSQSLKTINSMGKFINEIGPSLTQSELDNYIISTFALVKTPFAGELTGAIDSMYNCLIYWSKDMKEKQLNEIKATTVEDIKNMAASMEYFSKNQNYIVVGSPEVIEQHKDLFDTIVSLN